MEPERLNASISRRLAVGENEMLGWVAFKKGGIVPAHKHVSEQITFILKGALKFTIHGVDYTVRSGEVLVIPPNVVHEAVALEDTDDFDCFSPLREDWLTGKDLYLRTGRSYLKG
jgi:quercetin dioxygenase-like cupin family protein